MHQSALETLPKDPVVPNLGPKPVSPITTGADLTRKENRAKSLLRLRRVSLDGEYRLLKIRVSATTSVFDSAPGHQSKQRLTRTSLDLQIEISAFVPIWCPFH